LNQLTEHLIIVNKSGGKTKVRSKTQKLPQGHHPSGRCSPHNKSAANSRGVPVCQGASQMNRRKTTGIVASAVLAVLGALLLFMFVSGKGSSDTAAQPVTTVQTAQVWVAKAAIPAGLTADQLVASKLIEQKTVAITEVTLGTDTFNPQLLSGKITAQPIFMGEKLIEAKFQSVEDAVASEITPGQVAVSLILPAERMAGVGLLKDETVGIVSTFAANDTLKNVSHVTFHKIRIIGKPIPWGAPAAPPATTVEGQAPVAPAPYTGQMQVTLSVTSADAERLIFLNQFGTINLIREPLSAKEDGEKLVQFDNFYQQTAGSQTPSTTAVPTGVGAAPAAGAPTTVKAGGVAVKPSTTVVPTTVKK
jgi:pilus assembly protein CpaB